MCDLCKKPVDGVTWLGSPDGKIAVCDDCLQELRQTDQA